MSGIGDKRSGYTGQLTPNAIGAIQELYKSQNLLPPQQQQQQPQQPQPHHAVSHPGYVPPSATPMTQYQQQQQGGQLPVGGYTLPPPLAPPLTVYGQQQQPQARPAEPTPGSAVSGAAASRTFQNGHSRTK